jgi:hypothetical protein
MLALDGVVVKSKKSEFLVHLKKIYINKNYRQSSNNKIMRTFKEKNIIYRKASKSICT